LASNGDVIEFLKKKDYIMVNCNLGEGSFSKTVLLQDPYIDELFVAKKYEPEYPEIKERFFRNFLDEIKILYKMNHKNIVRIYNYYAYENIHTGYILMEYIDGTQLDVFIKNYDGVYDPVTLDEVLYQLVDAFQYIEEHGIIHRDIREGNILIDKSGTVKVIDFGIGKVYEPLINENDSLKSEINRESSDTLPLEYYQGIYTPKTDMFYLGELLNRLLHNMTAPEFNAFSHFNILSKMMDKNPDNRYDSFAAIKEIINKHDFSNLDISNDDKKIYQGFTNAVFRLIAKYTSTKKYITDPNVFLTKLDKVQLDNCFENEIQNISDLIRCIVVSGISFYPKEKVSCETVKRFADWYKSSTLDSQKLILSNIISKLSLIEEKINDGLPF
jgi:eukaryotic-like serine/threonine-protein kinase